MPIDIDDAEKTRRLVFESVAEAARLGARLVVLPELALCGSIFADAAESTSRAEPADGTSVRFFAELSDAFDLVLVAGFCEVSGLDLPYNSAVVVDHGRVLAVYRKTHLWDFENELFTPGDVLPPVVADLGRRRRPADLLRPRLPGGAAQRRPARRPAHRLAGQLARLRQPRHPPARGVEGDGRRGDQPRRGRRRRPGRRGTGPALGRRQRDLRPRGLPRRRAGVRGRDGPGRRRRPRRHARQARSAAATTSSTTGAPTSTDRRPARGTDEGTVASPLRDDRRRRVAQRLPNALSDP